MRATTLQATTRKNLALRVATVCVVGVLAACSSGKSNPTSTTKVTEPPTSSSSTSSSSTTTTLPSAATIASVRAFFAGPGKLLLTFQRATTAVAIGSVPTTATCLRLGDVVLPGLTKSPDAVIKLADRIPEPTLRSAFGQAIKIKIIMIQLCSGNAHLHRPPNTDPSITAGYKTAQQYSALLQQRLVPYGITI